MEQKVAGEYFNEQGDRIEAVIRFLVDNDSEDEVTISTKSGDIMICITKEDFDRIANNIKNSQVGQDVEE